MASILDNAVLVGKETTYGTAATLTDSYEADADTYKKSVEYIESVGMRAGQHSLRSDRSKLIPMGAEGTLSMDVLNQGFGNLLQGMLGSVSGPTQVASTTAYETTVATTAAGPDACYTVQILRADVDGTSTAFTHEGGVITDWEFAQALGDNLKLSLNFDFEDVQTATGAGTPAYPAGALPFDWTQAAATMDSGSQCITEFSLSGNLGLKTDRRCLRGSYLKKKPVRASMPVFEGSVTVEYEGNDLYTDFINGTIIPLSFVWTGTEIESGHNFSLTITIPAAQLKGDSPVVSLDDVPTQTIPFTVLHNGTDAAITMVYKSTDTTL